MKDKQTEFSLVDSIPFVEGGREKMRSPRPGDNCAIHPGPYASYARPKPTGKKIQEGKSEVPKNGKSESCFDHFSSVGAFRT